MRYSDLRAAIISQWSQPRGNSVAYLIKGAPGCGKSALGRDIITSLGGNDDNTVELNLSMRDPVDFLGTPNNSGDFTRWVPPEEFYKLRAGRPGDAHGEPCFINLEEMTDGAMPMQNAACRVIYDRCAGNLKLSPYLRIYASGNRTEDKSGATRLSTKLGNRVRQHDYENNLDDLVTWAQAQDIDPVLIQFWRYMPAAISDFDPNKAINATPRSWESVSLIDISLPPRLYFAEVRGCVGEGRAAEYTAFRKVYTSLVAIEDVIMNPTGVAVPDDLSALYATVGSCGHGATAGNVERLAVYIDRLPKAFATLFWQDARKRDPKIKATKAYISWVTANSNVIMN